MKKTQPQDTAKQPADNTTFWFPAKRFGLGWGLPVAWQGWLVLVAYVVLLAIGQIWLIQQQYIGLPMLYTFALTLILVLICWLKGERLR